MNRWAVYQSAKDKLLANIQMIPEAGCWVWMGQCNGGAGYGMMIWDDKRQFTHRLSWTIHRGPIPERMFVCHHCDVPSCCNPDHLFLGTCRENNLDSIRKGRWGRPRGEDAPGVKLTAEQVREIRAAYKPYHREFSTTALAKKYGIGKSQIHLIVTGKKWKHL